MRLLMDLHNEVLPVNCKLGHVSGSGVWLSTWTSRLSSWLPGFVSRSVFELLDSWLLDKDPPPILDKDSNLRCFTWTRTKLAASWLTVHPDQVRSVHCSPSNTSAPRCQQRLSCASRLRISRFPLAVLFIYNINNARQISSSMLQHSLRIQTSVITDGTVASLVTQLLPY
ncbi:hypothetical protein CHARACLAT_024849 [Characodon lateralis]|uniref:Uncharacterized protein n=1 Tax=Characodon lateralis TaxID=208331 RepID=A0ABU7F674_9TELE|nr:hypothetical protein [Characodon lateralis]